jgi:hypothetical protein
MAVVSLCRLRNCFSPAAAVPDECVASVKVVIAGRQGHRALTGRNRFGFAAQAALGEIDFLAAAAAQMGAVEFIREYLFFFAAFGAFAGK